LESTNTNASAVASVSSWAELDDHAKVLEMAQLSVDVLDGKNPCNAPWELKEVAKNRGGKIEAGLYVRQDSTCALAFTGSEEFKDWMDDAAIRHVDYCGLELVHEGFANSVERILTTGHFTFMDGVNSAMQGFLAGGGNIINAGRSMFNAHTNSTTIQEALKDCKQGLIATGHSKGGSLAEVFTACSHAGFSQHHEKWQGVKVDEVYIHLRRSQSLCDAFAEQADS